MTEITFGYEPREQFNDFHSRNQRWSCIVAHRRAGKTVACVNELIARALYTQKKNGRFAYIAPFYRQAKEIAWEYLKEYAGDAAVKVRESMLRVELFNGSWITLYGADNPDALRGLYFDGVVLDEYGDCRPSLWGEVVLPTLADRKGWAVFIGTPKGKNHFYKIYQRSYEESNWFHATLKASETGILGEEELNEMRAQMSEEQYLQEMECSFDAAVLGTYYAKLVSTLEQKGQVTTVPYDPEFPVEAATDLGFSDSCAWWFWQYRPDGVAVIDYHEAQGQPLDYYFDMLDSKPYEYDCIWLPHDAKAKTLQTGKSTAEQIIGRGYPCNVQPRLAVQHGIDAVRLVLPNCWFDTANTFVGIEALRAYRRTYDENKKTFSDKPFHDWSSNGADAFRGAALVMKNKLEPKAKVEEEYDPCKPPEWRLDKLFEEREQTLNVGGMARRRI